MIKCVFGAFAPLTAIAILAGSAAGQGGGNPNKGKQLYMDYSCYACHGYSGQNGPGNRLVPMKMAQAAFTAYVRNPRTKQMPSYSTKVMTDAQLGDIWAYVRTLPDAPKAEDIKLLKEIQAEVAK
jgi:mono/diheme cytochrome c family protein